MAFPINAIKIVGNAAGGASNAVTFGNLKNISIANAFRNIGAWFQTVGIGGRDFNGIVSSGGVSATGTVTLSASANADTVTINGVVFTEVASAPTNNQFVHGGTDTITAANLAAAINSSTTATIANNISATSAAAVVTVLSREMGTLGNLQTLAISAHGSVSGANLTGGTDGTVFFIAKGL